MSNFMRSLGRSSGLGMTKKALLLIVVTMLLLQAMPIFAADGGAAAAKSKPEGDVFTEAFLGGAGFTVLKMKENQDVRLYVIALIKLALSFTGFLFFILIFYGGYLWMAAGGNEEVLKKSKSIITKAVIGFAIVLASYSIVYFLGAYIGQAIVPQEGNVPGLKKDFILP